ncbi:MarR family transcriptional regulator [Ancylomarina salipaludis]|uniref:MarR family transcriptional regulator n=1 Tax=Ancylomarina salipaludis TaxID=2501299 RepID=A0A4Q1JNN5_9BACT|nr:MarR family transcriptional regulator [Ancylomarina salipaludis]RXQ96231.1 MarR family transcriptional regulator [Ancylomarina salipaludis]
MNSDKSLEVRKKELVEKFGLFMERQENLPPIAARIFASLFVNKGDGTTFDELVNFLSASKSTISTNIQLLTNRGMLTFFTKPGDRKKYFILSPESLLARVDEELIQYRMEYQIVKEIIDFREEINELDTNTIEVKSYPYLDFLSNSLSLLETLKENVKANCRINRQD